MLVGPAAGLVKTVPDVIEALKHNPSFLTIGSYTAQAREHVGIYLYDPTARHSHNLYGLPNPGLDYLVAQAAAIKHIVDAADEDELTPIRVSLVGKDADEFAVLAIAAAGQGFDELELNVSCPNFEQVNGQEPVVLDQILAHVIGPKVRPETVWVKLGPVTRTKLLDLAPVLENYKVAGVTITNTSEGAGGRLLIEHNLDRVRFITGTLGLEVTAVGGVFSQTDVDAYERCGAYAVQIGTAWKEGLFHG